MENLAKPVADVETGKLAGYVLDLAFDESWLMQIGYFVVDEQSEGEYLLRFQNIVAASDYILIDSVRNLEFVTERQKSLIGRKIISESGVDFGAVEKVVLKNKTIFKLCTNRCEIIYKMIKKIGDDFILLNEKKKKYVKNYFFKNNYENIKVFIQKENISPEKINLSMKYFVGKLATCDVFGLNHERIVAKNEIISKNAYENAKRHNKLNELFFATKK
jgi:sporulation protein YlmC with PRC-barrel domain